MPVTVYNHENHQFNNRFYLCNLYLTLSSQIRMLDLLSFVTIYLSALLIILADCYTLNKWLHFSALVSPQQVKRQIQNT